MQNTGVFYLYEVEFQPAGSMHAISGIAVRAHCHRCHRAFHACGPPLLSNVAEAGTIISCPGCGERQAVALAYLRELVAHSTNPERVEDRS